MISSGRSSSLRGLLAAVMVLETRKIWGRSGSGVKSGEVEIGFVGRDSASRKTGGGRMHGPEGRRRRLPRVRIRMRARLAARLNSTS